MQSAITKLISLRYLFVVIIFAVLIFMGETAWILSSELTAGIKLNTSSTFTQLLHVLWPQLLWLCARIMLVYIVLCFGIYTWVRYLTCLIQKHTGDWIFWFELILWTILVWSYFALLRPALFADVRLGYFLINKLIACHLTPPRIKIILSVLIAIHVITYGLDMLIDPAIKKVNMILLVPGLFILCMAHLNFFKRSQNINASKNHLVILYGIDALRPDFIYQTWADGLPVMPYLQAFLKDATQYERAYTPIAATEPAWYSLLSAQYPNKHGHRYALMPDNKTAQIKTFTTQFKEQGFQTHFYTDCSRFHAQTQQNGFTYLSQPPLGAMNFILEKARYRLLGFISEFNVAYYLLPEIMNNRALAGFYNPNTFIEHATSNILDAHQQSPTLAALHTTMTHFPGDAPYPFYNWAAQATGLPASSFFRMNFSVLNKGSTQEKTSQEYAFNLHEQQKKHYMALLSAADAQLGLLIKALKANHVYDLTTLVVFSDHGEDFYDDRPDLYGQTPVHGARINEVENKILLSIKYANTQDTTRVNHLLRTNQTLANLVDIGPTLLSAYQLPALASSDGQALQSLNLHEPRVFYFETGFSHVLPQIFDSQHYQVVPRSFDTFEILKDGRVAMKSMFHNDIIKEKDSALFDGQNWLFFVPQTTGQDKTICIGVCDKLKNYY